MVTTSSVLWRRIYRLRPLTAVALCLPSLLVGLWYAWNAHERFNVARRLEGYPTKLTLETYQIHLHDLLTRDLRRMTMAPPPEPSRLDVFTFHIGQEELDTLERGKHKSSGRTYAVAKLEHRGITRKAKLRLRGHRYWHTSAEQKSLKVRLPKGELLDDHRVFNLINDPSPMVVGEQLVLDLARKSGLLTPQAGFARVRMNATDLGVYRYETQADESLLRTHARVPGSIYSGDLSSRGDSWELWKSTKPWKKSASRSDDEASKQDFKELERLLEVVREATHREFEEFARYELDLQKFAMFDSIDIAFGGNRHNFRQNQKYAYDPYRGRWEPIAWSFEGFRDDPRFNLVEHPLLMRLKAMPSYLALRNRLLYEFLTGPGSYAALERRGIESLSELAPELNTDPFWDAHRLLSRIDEYHREMVRPMTMARAILVFRSELVTYRQRVSQLVRALEENPLYFQWSLQPTPKPGAQVSTRLELFVDGHVGARLERVDVSLPADCEPGELQLLRDERVLASATRAPTLGLTEPLQLLPTVGVVKQESNDDADGPVRTEPRPERYELELRTACAPVDVEVHATQLATGTRITAQPVQPALLARLPKVRSQPSDRLRFEPGEVAPHAWDFAAPTLERITLGPGEVSVAGTRVFGEHQEVEVLPGTRFKMGPRASLIFLGRVRFRGTLLEPIVVEPAAQQPWGGMALQGQKTSGSELSHVIVSGGSTPSWRLVSYPAMVNVHDTRDVTMAHCLFKENAGKGDVLHLAYVRGLDATDSRVMDASGDAWDLEFVTGTMRRVSAVNVGDDAIDLMGAKLELVDSAFVAVRGNGISAGEESKVTVRNSVISDAKVGLLAKNASDVDLLGTVLFRNETGVRTYQRTVRYAGDSRVTAHEVFAIQAGKSVVQRDGRSNHTLDHGRIRSGFPPPGVLNVVLEDVLGIEGWSDLENWSAEQRGGSVL